MSVCRGFVAGLTTDTLCHLTSPVKWCHLKDLANCATLCQVTQGKKPEWADTSWAQWIKERLDERGWKKKDLIAALAEASDLRLSEDGAAGLVNRVTKRGRDPNEENAILLTLILGPRPTGRPEGLEARVAVLENALRLLGPNLGDLASLPERVLALEHLAQPKTGQGGR